LVDYVATRGFSATARELFDMVWQTKDGLLRTSKIRAAYDGTDYEVELALWELFRGAALFEMFRFDSEDRLVRFAGLLSEIRQYRESASISKGRKTKLKARRKAPSKVQNHELGFTDTICRLVAAIAAKPVRLRGDGELFQEDRRALEEICPESTEPSLNTCLWAAENVGWLGRVDNELRAGELEPLLEMERLDRHRALYDWVVSGEGDEVPLMNSYIELLGGLKPNTWYRAVDFVHHVREVTAENEEPVLKSMGGHWQFVSPGSTVQAERTLARLLEEIFHWLGVVARADSEGESLFAVTDLGHYLLTGNDEKNVPSRYPQGQAEIIVQPNFDIVVPTQDMDPLLTVPLDQFAVRSSTGQATVYNVTKESFTQALQDGHNADAFVDFLVAHNRGGSLPANVMTTLDDWHGGIKRVRLRTIHMLESDDSLVLADLLHRRRYKKYLKPVDPHRTARYSKISKSNLAKMLEKDGFIVE